ncbi:MAG: hypothetical protein IKZ09_09360 [Clostridia bacterium]|nr:hypothetical protein [Clostridia bacterium]
MKEYQNRKDRPTLLSEQDYRYLLYETLSHQSQYLISLPAHDRLGGGAAEFPAHPMEDVFQFPARDDTVCLTDTAPCEGEMQ